LQAIADELNARGIPTARGEKWAQVPCSPSRPHRQAQRKHASTRMTGK
jgi:hypothetical protein